MRRRGQSRRKNVGYLLKITGALADGDKHEAQGLGIENNGERRDRSGPGIGRGRGGFP